MSQISPSDYSIKEITHLQQACWLVFLPSSSLILTSPTGHMLCRLQSASLVQEAANQSQGSRSWWALLACKVRGRWASWIVPWLCISWSETLCLGKDLYDYTKFLLMFMRDLHSSLYMCDEKGRDWTTSPIVKVSACLSIHVLSLVPFHD